MSSYVPETELNRAYWAGLFDGEGCISIHTIRTVRVSSGFIKNIRVSFGQKNYPMVKHLQDKFGGHIHPSTSSGVWLWYVERAESCIKFLEYVLPYLTLRETEARLAIAYCSLILQKKIRNAPLSDKEIATRALIEEKMEAAKILRQQGYMEKPSSEEVVQ